MLYPNGGPVVSDNRGDRLDSWKEIASHLKRGVRTVQRWEREAGLPVHRLATERRGVVHAYGAEIDDWWQSRSSVLAIPDEKPRIAPAEQSRTTGWRLTGLISGVALIVSAVVAAETFLSHHNLEMEVVRRLTWEGNIVTPALSPDGKWIAFASPRLNQDANLDLWIGTATGENLHRLTNTFTHEFDPVFASDSSRILYSVSVQKPAGMMVVEGPPPPSTTSLFESGLSGRKRLLMAHAGEGRYSSDGRWIALLRAGPSLSEREFGIMPASGGEFIAIPVRASADDVLLASSPAVWSPDNRFILLSARTLKTARNSWWLVNMASRTATQTVAIEEMLAAGFVAPPVLGGLAPQAWLPDGTVLTKGFGSDAIGIWSVKLDPRSGHLLGRPTKLPAPLTELRWFSVAGRRILFDGGEILGGLDAIPFNLDTALTLAPSRAFRRDNPGGYGYLSLSADGRTLAFSSRQASGTTPGAFILDLDTGHETRILGPGGDFSTAQEYTTISANGKKVAYGVAGSSRRPVYVWDSVTGKSELITADCACRPLSWTPDGLGLLVALPGTRTQSIAFLDVKTRQLVEILRDSAAGLNLVQVSPSGGHVLFTTLSGAGFVAPFRGSRAMPQDEWKSIGSAGNRISGIFWSPDGTRLYFAVAHKDGTRILSQSFNETRGEVIGAPWEALQTDWEPTFGRGGTTGIVAAGNRIVLPTATVGSDLWSARLTGNR